MSRSNCSPAYLLSRQNALARLLAARILSEPDRAVAIVQANLKRWMPNMDRRSIAGMEPWIEASGSAVLLAKLLTISGEHGDFLRSMAPFAGVLSSNERLDFLRAYESRIHDS